MKLHELQRSESQSRLEAAKMEAMKASPEMKTLKAQEEAAKRGNESMLALSAKTAREMKEKKMQSDDAAKAEKLKADIKRQYGIRV